MCIRDRDGRFGGKKTGLGDPGHPAVELVGEIGGGLEEEAAADEEGGGNEGDPRPAFAVRLLAV